MKIKLLFFTLALLFGLTSWAGAETVDDLKKQLDAAKQAIQALESRLQALEAAQAKPVPAPVTAAGNSVKAQKAIADISNALGGNPYAVKPR